MYNKPPKKFLVNHYGKQYEYKLSKGFDIRKELLFLGKVILLGGLVLFLIAR